MSVLYCVSAACRDEPFKAWLNILKRNKTEIPLPGDEAVHGVRAGPAATFIKRPQLKAVEEVLP